MNFFELNLKTKSDHLLFKVSMNAAFLWLLIVFVLRKVFVYFHLNLFLLGILPNFFAGIGIYLLTFLKFHSKLISAILTLGLLTLGEVIQLYTPRTFDPLDILASCVGIGTAEVIMVLIGRRYKNNLKPNDKDKY